MDVSKNSGTPESSILIGFSTINHPFWGYPYFWKHLYGRDLKFTSAEGFQVKLCHILIFESMKTNAKWNFTGILRILLLRKSKHVFPNGGLISGLMVIYHGTIHKTSRKKQIQGFFST